MWQFHTTDWPDEHKGTVKYLTEQVLSAASGSISAGAYVQTIKDIRGRGISYNYNQIKGTLTSVTDQKNVTTSYAYNANNDLLTSVSSGGKTVAYGYDAKNQLSKITHNGFVYDLAYDGFGNRTTTKIGSRTLSTNTYRTNNGQLDLMTYGNGATRGYTYNRYGLMSSLVINGASKHSWFYNNQGMMTRYVDKVNSRTHFYEKDSLGRLSTVRVMDHSVLSNNNRTLYTSEYDYDVNNNMTRELAKAYGVTLDHRYEYGKDNLPEKFSMISGARETDYTYDSLGRLYYATTTTDVPVVRRLAYSLSARNAAGSDTYRTTEVCNEFINDKVYRYTYDTAGNITRIDEGERDTSSSVTAGKNYVTKVTYEYDSLGGRMGTYIFCPIMGDYFP